MLKVLVACEESQRVCIAFRNLGHEAYSCDIIDCSGGHPEWHIKQDVLPLLNGVCEFHTCDGLEHHVYHWDLIIGFPSCTYLTNASAVRMFKQKTVGDTAVISLERLNNMIKARDFFLKILNADCKFIAVENPTPMKITNLPPYNQVIQPYEFGHPYSKRTCLWLKNLPELKSTNIVEHHEPWVNGGNLDAHGNYRRFRGRGERDPKNRSKTFEGVAKAMAEQWSEYVVSNS